MSSDRIRFFGLSEDKMYYDERKKRFVSTANAPAYIQRELKNNHFKTVSINMKINLIFRFSNDPIFMVKKRGNLKRSWSMVSIWSVTWTIRQNWKWEGFGEPCKAVVTNTSILCSMTTWHLTISTDQGFCVRGLGRTVRKSLISLTCTCYKHRNMDLTSQSWKTKISPRTN